MTSKQELINLIKEWISCDNKIKQIQKIAKETRAEKKLLTESLVTIMKENEIDCFDINDGKLVYKQNKIKKPLSKKHLVAALLAYYKDDPGIAEDVGNFIMETREENIKEVIHHKIPKSKEE